MGELGLRPALVGLGLGAMLMGVPQLQREAGGYPLDGHELTGIPRLEGERLIQEGEISGRRVPPGELMPLAMVRLRLLDQPDFQLPPPDPEFTQRVVTLLGQEADRYGIALLDLADPYQPRYAEWQGSTRQNPGSVGKIVVALAVLQLLADIYPNDVEARRSVLRNTMITADVFSQYDHHTVPFWDPVARRLTKRPIQEGDRASLYTYLDWMLSPSSNSAAGMVQKQLLLLKHYGADYPVSAEESDRFFRETPARERGEIFAEAIQSPLTRNGLDLQQIRQGSFFTRGGKNRVPGTTSYATPRALMEFLVRMEKGQLVDEFSSLELKRLLYLTERRIRYASSPALANAAVYFKSGSLYSCREEPGFTCRKYHGNKRNYMNSVAIVESPAGQPRMHYISAILSNVLRKNSAVDHQRLGTELQRMLEADHPPAPGTDTLAAELEFGRGFIGYEEQRARRQLAVQTQQGLADLGYDVGKVDGMVGPQTRAALKAFQKDQGLVADGEPSEAMVEALRQAAQKVPAVPSDMPQTGTPAGGVQ